ncbi:XTP/dITP diphosphohydrolase [Austwickia chelonae]|uniref:MazG family protein n=2 Tax=Austwickia TaxID=1184606 RepID=K6V737_9MICO|nr:MazG family protein [Austwickia chelonae NBRC 105200]SEV94321.1 XTP/dITP diphosphohydrolase [Austwickia chelonae]
MGELVEVMDLLRAPGGCPWDARQTHRSLAPYAVEEAYELAEAVLTSDRGHLREELGDLLLQVVFHARVAQEDESDPFDVDDVARGVVAKLRRRHPHVFADGDARTPEQVEARWDELKAEEKPERRDVLDGIPVGMPAFERATKVVARLDRAGQLDRVRVLARGEDIGSRMLQVILEARESGVDPSAALRETLRGLDTAAQPTP